jgi:endo-1,4-beta-xylanase
VICWYKDKAKICDTAGEVAGRRVSNVYDFWTDKIGPEYIEMAFRWARKGYPDGILLFTDSNMDSHRDPEFSAYINTMLAMVKGMKSRGSPIDAVGIEGHLFVPSNSLVPPTKEGVFQTMREFGALGVNVYITEMDVTLTLLPGSREEKLALQSQVYKAVMDARLEAGNCKGFGIWGIDDDHAWSMCLPNLGCPPNIIPEPLLFDNNFNPKPAYYAIIRSLQEH